MICPSFISNVPTSLFISYPLGAEISSNVYFPSSKVNLFPSLLEVNSITFPSLNPSVQVIFILAPSITLPVVTSVLVKIKSPCFLSSLRLAFVISPSFISNVPTSLFILYPLGAEVSSNVYFPSSKVNLFPSFEEVKSITFPFDKPSVQVIFILAPSITLPSVTSVLVKIKSPCFLSSLRLAFVISPSFISNVPTSLFILYPSGANVSSNVYFPSGSVNLLPSLEEVNSMFICLFCGSNPVILTLAPSIESPVVTSVLLKSNSPVFTVLATSIFSNCPSL
ncbi:BspA-related protein [Clostridium perfringens B str. ATCC 3626]|uniref:BspA-related protein n=1 Tax=Clostridium perfringens B str. ATCC 3626 TaxID=451754 RepID=A0AAV3BSN9_CLOPF|nr:BspA-related protein [Clostridium perfringens B str. ATCC 3626]